MVKSLATKVREQYDALYAEKKYYEAELFADILIRFNADNRIIEGLCETIDHQMGKEYD